MISTEEKWARAALVTACLALLVILFSVWGCGDGKAWEAFKVAHRCKLVGVATGGTAITSGGHIAFLPDTESWLCDDGLTHTVAK